MNREIKFIIQNKETKEIYGHEWLTANYNWLHTFKDKTIHGPFEKSKYGLGSSSIIRRQYIGLKDKDEKEIYERDDVYDSSTMTLHHIGDIRKLPERWFVDGYEKFLEIKRNIHENPELIKTKKA